MNYYSISILFVTLLLFTGCNAPPPATGQSTHADKVPPVLAIQSPRVPLEIVAGDGQLGTADFGEVRSCLFKLRNNTLKPVTLQVVDKSCTCAGIELPTQPVEPGQEANVTVRWSPKVEVLESSMARLWAEISTGDEQKVRLEATGTIEPTLLVAFPRGPLDLGKLSLIDLNQPQHQLVVEVYSKRDAFPVPTAQLNTAGLELVSVVPLSADRISSLQAKAGYRITLKPNKQLPHGSLQAQLRVETSLKKTPLLLPVIGHFDTSAISLSQERLQLPPQLSLQKGYRLPAVTITVRYGACTSCEIAGITPPLFDAKLTPVNSTTWKLELALIQDQAKLQQRFTPDAWQQLLNFGFEQGSITLKLNHPDIKTLTIPFTGCQLRNE